MENEQNEQELNTNQMNKSYVQILNEMFVNQTSYVEKGRSGPQHKPLFRIGVHVAGLTFDGISHTKQRARHEAARNAINYFRDRHEISPNYDNYHNYDHNPHNPHNYYRYSPYNRLNRYNDYQQRSTSLDMSDPHSSSGQTSGQTSGQYYNFYSNKSPLYSRERPHIVSESTVTTDSTSQTSNQMNVDLSLTDGNDSKKGNDFTADDYNSDNFVEFDVKTDGHNDEDREETQQKTQPIPKPKKQRIILRVMSETPVNENPVSVIHELHPNAKWVSTEITTKKNCTVFEMRLLLPLANQCFIGRASTKKLAKNGAASQALLELYNISLNGPNCENSELRPKNTVKIAEEPLVLKQVSRQPLDTRSQQLSIVKDIADRVGAAVMLKCTQVWDQLTDLKKWTVLSAIVLTDETNVDLIDVICLTSGTKCVKGDSLSMNGYALNDCHAEVLCRRSFLHYIYGQIERLIDNNFEDKPDLILERRPDGQGFRLKPNIKVNLFISTAPCGDSRVFSPKEEEGDPHPNRQTRGVLRAKIEGGEGTIPIKRDSIQTWDGILQGHQRLQFMSCSDKIAVWNVVGVQGALLSHLIEPIYLSSVVLASLFNYEHLVRALHGRLHLNFDSNCLKGLPEGFAVNKCKVAKCHLKQDITRQLTKAPNYAIDWVKGDDRPEVVSTETGRTHIENSISRLAKRSLFGRFCALLGRNTPVLANCCLGQNIPVVYRDGKTASLDYQRAKTQCIQSFQEQNLGNWLQVPAETDLFRL